MIASGIYQFKVNAKSLDKMLIPFPLLTKVLSLLLNSSVTELDCTVFDSYYSQNFSNFLFKHALSNCPKINKITLMDEKLLMLDNRSHDILPVELFKGSWNNLRSIHSRQWYLCTDHTLKFIQENYPNIESVSLIYYVDIQIIY
jgi:hypothetical protein